MAKQEPQLEQLQIGWKEMYQKTLPTAALAKSPTQPKWPVHNDHCFARIILDSVIGIDSAWTSKIKSPAYKNMSKEQLEASIQLGREILGGEADLVGLDEKSLEGRGKKGKSKGAQRKQDVKQHGKRKREIGDIDDMEEGVGKKRKQAHFLHRENL